MGLCRPSCNSNIPPKKNILYSHHKAQKRKTVYFHFPLWAYVDNPVIQIIPPKKNILYLYHKVQKKSEYSTPSMGLCRQSCISIKPFTSIISIFGS